MEANSCSWRGLGKCFVNVQLNRQTYRQVSLTVLKDLPTNVFLGQDFMDRHQNANIRLGGPQPTLHLGALQNIKTSTFVKLFKYL